MLLLLIKNNTVFFYHQSQPGSALQPLQHEQPIPPDHIDDYGSYSGLPEV